MMSTLPRQNVHLFEGTLTITSGKIEKEKVFLSCYCHEIYTVEAVGFKKNPITNLTTYHFCEYVKFGAISSKINILPVTA